MKNILLLTDFSPVAGHAAAFAYSLAVQIKADLLLYNAVQVPADTPLASFVSWPMIAAEELVQESNNKLKKLRLKLNRSGSKLAKKPKIIVGNQKGSLKDVVAQVLADQSFDLTVMGAHGALDLSKFVFGSQTRYMIDTLDAPLLLVPIGAIIKPIKKIVFATDFKSISSDKEFMHLLIPLARAMEAEIFVSHIYTQDQERIGFHEMVHAFVREFRKETKFTKLSYRSIECTSIKNGLKTLMTDGEMDMLAMVHREKSFLSDIVNGSLTKQMASTLPFPLLVFKKSIIAKTNKIKHVKAKLSLTSADA